MDDDTGAAHIGDVFDELLPGCVVPGIIGALPNGTAEDLAQFSPVRYVVAFQDDPEGRYGQTADLAGISDVEQIGEFIPARTDEVRLVA